VNWIGFAFWEAGSLNGFSTAKAQRSQSFLERGRQVAATQRWQNHILIFILIFILFKTL